MEKPPPDPGDHAQDFSRRYADWADYLVSQRMLDLDIDASRIGTPDFDHGIQHAAFQPDYRNAGGVSPDGRIVIESGLFNPARMDHLGPEVSRAWGRARWRDRLDAVIAHEFEEHASGSHEGAVERAADAHLPIREGARQLLRVIAEGEKRGR
jgi:hypothetical protein